MFSTRCRVHDIISNINDNNYPRKAIGGQIRLTLEKDGPLDQYVKLQADPCDIGKPIRSRYALAYRREIVIGKWPELDWCEDCFGLCLVLKKINEHPVNLEFPKLTLLQLQYQEDSRSIPIDFFRSMKMLRGLSLDLPLLPHPLNLLRNLKKLHLKVQRLEDMSGICRLLNLEFLSISVPTSTDISRDLGELENLKLLDLREMNVAYIPRGVLSKLVKLEELYLPLSFRKWGCTAKQCDDYDEWESGEEDNYEGEARINANCNEIDDGGRINASLIEIVSLSLNVLQICVPKASYLPKKSPIFKNVREFNIFVPHSALYQPFGNYSVNVLQLTGEAFDIKESGICDLFSLVEELSLIRVQNLRNIIYQLEEGFPQLKKMVISECSELEFVVEATEEKILSEVGQYFLRKLECLHLSMLYNLKQICCKRWTNLSWFSKLTHVSIRFCPKLTYVFPLSIVRGLTLKRIEILDCHKMEGIFYEDEEDSSPLTHWSIEKLELHSLPRLISFLVHKDGKSDGVENDIVHSLTSNEVPLTKIKDLVSHMDMEMYTAFSSRSAVTWFRNLKSLKIAFCDLVEVVFLFEESHATSKAFNSLEVLELHGLRNLAHIWFQIPPKSTYFKNLQLLVLTECGNLYLFSYWVAKLLVQLQKVYVSRCEKMKEIITGKDVIEEEGRIVLRRLKLLVLQHMPSLEILSGVSFEMDLPLLESLRLKECDRMKSLSDGLLKMPMLKGIEINGSLISLTKEQNLISTRVAAPRKYTLSDLKIATKNFSSLLGKGAFADIYEGWIDSNTFTPSITSRRMLVAVKRYNRVKSSNRSRRRMGHVERDVLRIHSHPNLVKLIGSCFEDKESALVYELVPGGSLHDHLSKRNPGIKPLPWDLRIKIAIGVARGINCLHTSEPKVIHANIKPHNILLDNDYNSKLADFGLALWGPSNGDSHVSSMNCNAKICDFGLAKLLSLGESEVKVFYPTGTVGYMAPENMDLNLGGVSAKSDVYSFGMVLLDLIVGSGVGNILEKISEEEENEKQEESEEEAAAPNLVEVRKRNMVEQMKLQKRELKDIVDPSMEGQYSSKAMLLMLELASKCTEYYPEKRPTMGEVLEKLHEIDVIELKDHR